MRIIETITERLSILLKYIAAALMFSLALMILTDVTARGIFNRPVLGIAELVASSVVIVAFLQLSYSIRFNSMLRAEVMDTIAGPRLKSTLTIFGFLLGAVFFAFIVYASWTPMIRAWVTSEYAAEGGLRVPTYPIRATIVFCSALAALNYVLHAVREMLYFGRGIPPVTDEDLTTIGH